MDIIDLASQADPPLKRRKLDKPPRQPPSTQEPLLEEDFPCIVESQSPAREEIRDPDVDLSCSQGEQHFSA